MGGILSSSYRYTREFYGSGIKKALGIVAVSFLVGSPIHVWVAGVGAAMSEWILWVIYGFAPMVAFTIFLFLYNLWLAPYHILKERLDKGTLEPILAAPEKAIMADWKFVDAIPLNSAACLWVGLEPHGPPLRDQRARAALALLKGAAKTGKLSCPTNSLIQLMALLNGNDNYWPSGTRYVRTVALASYARSTGRRVPEFLKDVVVPVEVPLLEGTVIDELPPEKEEDL